MSKKSEHYMEVVKHILEDERFKVVESIPHHGTNRLEHLTRVSYLSYKIARKMGLDYRSAAIAGLLHDYYTCDEGHGFWKYLKFQYEHPQIAAENAYNDFGVSKKEQNIIATHMCPFTRPSIYLEGWVVSFADKVIATYEYSVKFKQYCALKLVALFNVSK